MMYQTFDTLNHLTLQLPLEIWPTHQFLSSPPARAKEISKASTLTRLGHSRFKPEKSLVIPWRLLESLRNGPTTTSWGWQPVPSFIHFVGVSLDEHPFGQHLRVPWCTEITPHHQCDESDGCLWCFSCAHVARRTLHSAVAAPFKFLNYSKC